MSRAKPGGTFKGTVEVTGGDHQVSIGYIALVLVTDARPQGGLPGQTSTVEIHRQRVVEGFTLAARERRIFDITCDVPMETPLTRAFGQPLAGMNVGLRTELEVAREVDRTDLDPVQVDPTPAQQHILDTLTKLGFQFVKADVERGRLRGLPQTLPFYQEIEFLPGTAYAAHLHNLQVTFVGTDRKLHVVMELDRKVGPSPTATSSAASPSTPPPSPTPTGAASSRTGSPNPPPARAPSSNPRATLPRRPPLPR
ncbi:sporulation protein [Catellatospora bangladeshensis]|uniref:sporulation protein n=1 Tax=Catellatospora bangladeshensis TaxID=310355 RepID=UPI00360DD6EE